MRIPFQFNLIPLNLSTIELNPLNPGIVILSSICICTFWSPSSSQFTCLIWNDLPLGRQLNPSPPWEPEFFPYSTLYYCHFFCLLIYSCNYYFFCIMAPGISKREQARNEKTLAELIRTIPGNDRCADCDALSPGMSLQNPRPLSLFSLILI